MVLVVLGDVGRVKEEVVSAIPVVQGVKLFLAVGQPALVPAGLVAGVLVDGRVLLAKELAVGVQVVGGVVSA